MATVMKARQLRRIRRERLGNVNPLLLCIMPLALPIAIFHFVSGRMGNGIMATGAMVAGTVVILISARNGSEPQQTQPTGVFDDLDDSDGGSAWLDQPTDRPLPGPFQEVWEEIMREDRWLDTREHAPTPLPEPSEAQPHSVE